MLPFPNDGDKYASMIVLQLAHFSVKEYLESSRIREGKAAGYRLQERSAHESIAECCLAYLLIDDVGLPRIHRYIRSPVIPPNFGLITREMQALIVTKSSNWERDFFRRALTDFRAGFGFMMWMRKVDKILVRVPPGATRSITWHFMGFIALRMR
jgi:hypothetical protein